MSIKMSGPYNSGTPVGANGSALVSTDYTVTINGEVRGIYVRYNGANPPATADLTIKTLGSGIPSYNLLVITDGNTNGLFLVRKGVVDAAAAALTFDGTRLQTAPIPVFDGITIALAQGNAANTVDVWLLYE